MNETKITAPYIHTEKTVSERFKDWGTALIPVTAWSVFMFGARVITLCSAGALFSLLFDIAVRRFILKLPKRASVDPMVCIYAVLAVFTMPVTVPLFAPVVSSALVVTAKNLRLIRKKRLFNPFIFSAAVMNAAFPEMMTAFTRPFAYFSAFDIVIDKELMAGYRVISPLQYMADGSVYEDGIAAQLYGFASGNMGEIAVCAIIISVIYLAIRREADILPSAAMLFSVLLLALAFPSADAESNYYAYSLILTGGAVFIAAYALNERHTVPVTRTGRMIFGVLCGVLIFVFRKACGGFECGYYALLLLNILSPILEKLTKPRIQMQRKKTNAAVKQPSEAK